MDSYYHGQQNNKDRKPEKQSFYLPKMVQKSSTVPYWVCSHSLSCKCEGRSQPFYCPNLTITSVTEQNGEQS